MMPRIFHRLYAGFFGYFWLSCPVCRKMFGGHEVGDWPAAKIGENIHMCVCSQECSEAANKENR